MPKNIVIDEFHVTVFVTPSLASIESAAIRRSLRSAPFRSRLKRAVQAVFRRYRPLHKTRLKVSR
jgi:hypothetical protein